MEQQQQEVAVVAYGLYLAKHTVGGDPVPGPWIPEIFVFGKCQSHACIFSTPLLGPPGHLGWGGSKSLK